MAKYELKDTRSIDLQMQGWRRFASWEATAFSSDTLL